MFTLEELEAEVIAFQERSTKTGPDAEGFDTLLAKVVAYQHAHIPALARFWEGRGFHGGLSGSATVTPDDVTPVPTEVFRSVRLVSDERLATRVFRTSGTTAGKRGEAWRLSTGAYDAGAVLQFERYVMRGLERAAFVPLVFDPAQVPDSSLSHMVGDLRRHFDSATLPYFLEPENLRASAAWQALRTLAENDDPVLVFGTAFALINLLDAEDGSITLPARSVVVETGGFKGRSREVSRGTLYELISGRLGVPRGEILSEYSMTELSSQLYTVPKGGFIAPPWVRIIIRDPQTLAPLADGDQGLVSFVDLANIEVPVAILTSDFGTMADGRLSLNGRAPGATPRGCSLAVEEVLALANRQRR
jgi:hypothetical protein